MEADNALSFDHARSMFQPEPAHADAGLLGQRERADTLHSLRNISVWISYLPRDCVATMIKMGWHHST